MLWILPLSFRGKASGFRVAKGLISLRMCAKMSRLEQMRRMSQKMTLGLFTLSAHASANSPPA